MDGSKGSGSRTRALQTRRSAGGLGEDSALANNDDVTAAKHRNKMRTEQQRISKSCAEVCTHRANVVKARSHLPELLLQFANKSGLDLVEVLQLAERHKGNDGLSGTIKIKLSGSREGQSAEISLEIGGSTLRKRKS